MNLKQAGIGAAATTIAVYSLSTLATTGNKLGRFFSLKICPKKRGIWFIALKFVKNTENKC